MSNYIGKPERASQDRVIKLFQTELGYTYLGDWEKEVRTQPIEDAILKEHLKKPLISC
jgi:type I restriction enzyme R subunit